MNKLQNEYELAIARNLEDVQDKIFRSARKTGRSPEDIKLVVVTKTHPLDIVRCVVAAGARYLGENYVEEAEEKIHALRSEAQCSWHMIGHVQSRKAGLIVDNFDYLHSLDSTKLAVRLDRQAQEKKRILPVLLEFNVSGETNKSGWQLEDDASWDETLPDIEAILSLQNLRVCGLMTMPPFLLDPDEVRPYFSKLRRFSEYLQKQIGSDHFVELSMGMSGDYEVAIEEGATWVRIGQAILGLRKS